jgi:hypothetical protein
MRGLRALDPGGCGLRLAHRRVDALADTVLTALFDHFADWGTYFGVPNATRSAPGQLLPVTACEREDVWLPPARHRSRDLVPPRVGDVRDAA